MSGRVSSVTDWKVMGFVVTVYWFSDFIPRIMLNVILLCLNLLFVTEQTFCCQLILSSFLSPCSPVLEFLKAGSCGRVAAAADCSASVVLEVLVWTCLRHMIHNDINNAAHTHAFQSCLGDWHNSSHPVSHPGVRFHAFCTVWESDTGDD